MTRITLPFMLTLTVLSLSLSCVKHPGTSLPLRATHQRTAHKYAASQKKKKADPTEATPEGDTTLHLVMKGPHVEKITDKTMNKMVVLLLATGADPNTKDRKHKLALDFALKHFFHKAAMSLLAIGCDIVPFKEVKSLYDSHEVCRSPVKMMHIVHMRGSIKHLNRFWCPVRCSAVHPFESSLLSVLYCIRP